MAKIDPEIQRQLIKHWVPQLRAVERKRRPIFYLMVTCIVVPLIIAAGLVINQGFILNDIDAAQSLFSGILCGVSALAFRYLGALQNCNDVLVWIEGCVRLGDKDALLRVIPHLSCLGAFKGIIEDAKQLFED